jgi:hypothetical protein
MSGPMISPSTTTSVTECQEVVRYEPTARMTARRYGNRRSSLHARRGDPRLADLVEERGRVSLYVPVAAFGGDRERVFKDPPSVLGISVVGACE